MLPPISDPVWKKLLSGEKQIHSNNLAINMVIHNCRIRYKHDPAKANEIVQHAYEVFAKHEKTIAAELAQLQS